MKTVTYKYGTRRDIIYCLHGFGLLNMKMLSILPGNRATQRKKIKEMVREEMLAEHDAPVNGRKRIYTIDEYEKNMKSFSDVIDRECIQYYRMRHKTKVRDAWSKTRKAKAQRYVYGAEIKAMMYSSGINCMPDEPKSFPAYLPSDEVKSFIGYTDNVKETNEGKKVSFSKVYGLLASDGGNYAIYNTDKKNLIWLSDGEYKIKIQLARMLQKQVDSKAILEDAIMFVPDLKDIIPFLDIGNKKSAGMYGIMNVYRSVYILPYDDSGRDMLKVMTSKDWRYLLLEASVGGYQDTKNVNYTCDHYDPKTETGTLVFCNGDIGRLKAFTDVAKIYNNREKFKVICFDFQKDFVRAFTQGSCRILTTPLSQYISTV